VVDITRPHCYSGSNGVSGVTPGAHFGQKLFHKWWKNACDNLGIKDVDLYRGTRHSSTNRSSKTCHT